MYAFREATAAFQRAPVLTGLSSGFGRIEATHSGEFMGIAPTGKRVKIPYMDFWKVTGGRIADNWVSVDFPAVLAQLGRDVFDGRGWERLDDSSLPPPNAKEDQA
jgi:hypothetical protein